MAKLCDFDKALIEKLMEKGNAHEVLENKNKATGVGTNLSEFLGKSASIQRIENIDGIR